MPAKCKCTEKAYKNLDFLTSPEARVVRMLAEYPEPLKRFEEEQIENTIVFFGSARLRSTEDVQKDMRRESRAKKSPAKTRRMQQLKEQLDMARYYDDAVELARMLAVWSNALPGNACHYAICTGGGGGIVEAANRGARLGGGRSIGLNISLPFEQTPNAYISDDLCFEFHYFFMRKLWFAMPAKAMAVFPGGFGTFDELFELLTLVQTGKLGKHVPIVLYGPEFWDDILDVKALARRGLINPGDVELVHKSDTPQDAFDFLTSEIRCERPPRGKRRTCRSCRQD